MTGPRFRLVVVAVAIFVPYAASTGGEQRATPPPTPAVLLAVGDIMDPENPQAAEHLGRLMTEHVNRTPTATVIGLGDMVQGQGTRQEYDLFERSSWGALRNRIFYVPGNHDYYESVRISPGIVPHIFRYFPVYGRRIEDGYYGLDRGGWRLLAVNSELMARVDGKLTQRAVEMLAWLRDELSRYAKDRCVAVFMHRPMFSSGGSASPEYVERIYGLLYRYGVDLLLTGHEHMFIDMPPLAPPAAGKPKVGVLDPLHGIPALTFGTGGGRLFRAPKKKIYAENVVANTLGIGRITLSPGKYEWRFVPVDPAVPSPSGTGRCHDNPTG